MKRVVICSHVVFVKDKDVFGPSHAISEFLTLNKIPHLFIKHSLYDSRPSILEEVNRDKKSKFFLPSKFSGNFRFPIEALSTLFYILTHSKIDVYIAIDPLNALPAILGKMSGKIENLIFYTVDYSEKRFGNPVLNLIYHFLDKLAIRYSDRVWGVSSRIIEKRKEQKVPDKKNILVPNSPILRLMPKALKKENGKKIVFVANFIPALSHEKVIMAVASLIKRYKNIKLNLIGTGEREEKLKTLVKKMKVAKNVDFLGFMGHEKALEEIGKNDIGIAIYSNNSPWTSFGDSLKSREYMAMGLPVIITNNVSTSNDIKKNNAGFSINLSIKELEKSLNKLFSDSSLYSEMRTNALNLAKSFDLEKILKKNLLDQYSL